MIAIARGTKQARDVRAYRRGALTLIGDMTDEAAVLTWRFDLDAIRRQRDSWGIFRDRRPDLYRTLGSADGR